MFYHIRSVTVALLHINAGDCYNLRVKSVICQVERFNLTCREYAILFVFKIGVCTIKIITTNNIYNLLCSLKTNNYRANKFVHECMLLGIIILLIFRLRKYETISSILTYCKQQPVNNTYVPGLIHLYMHCFIYDKIIIQTI